MTRTPTNTPNPVNGRFVDLDRDPRIGSLTQMLRDVSAVKDPAEVLKAFGPWVGNRFPRDAFISVSTRDLPPGRFKITRAITNTQDPMQRLGSQTRDPWREWVSLPTFEGGVIGEIIERGQPQIVTDANFTLDPVLGRVLGADGASLRSLTAMPAYDDGAALNWSVSFHRDNAWDDLSSFVAGLLDVNLMGTATRNLVFRKQAEQLNGQLVGQFEQIAKIQRQLLPDHSPRIDGVGLATSYLTSDIAGGDYYDYYLDSHGRIGIVIADVSGHGPGAATVMAMMRAILHCYPDTVGADSVLDDVAAIARYCNEKLVNANLNGEFATAFFCMLDPRDGTLSWTRAGHNPPLLRLSDGTIEQLQTAGTLPLGITEDAAFESDSRVLGVGDTLILYTDGITEATARATARSSVHEQGPISGYDQFGVERMINALTHCSGEPGCVIDSVHRGLFEFTRRFDRDDDQTLVVVQRKAMG